MARVHPLILLALLGALILGLREQSLVKIPYLSGPERQDIPALAWRRCADVPRVAPTCVIDGDTIRIEGETVRLTGLDTPEVRGACEAERIAAEVATRELVAWLNEGAFTMRGPSRDTDKYGRPLRQLYRGSPPPFGTGETAADALIEAGVARPYSGEARRGWCDRSSARQAPQLGTHGTQS